VVKIPEPAKELLKSQTVGFDPQACGIQIDNGKGFNNSSARKSFVRCFGAQHTGKVSLAAYIKRSYFPSAWPASILVPLAGLSMNQH
jgi:hypothetical protein